MDRQSATADAFSDARTGSTVDHVDLGVAGCVDAAGTPGGTALSATSWSILGGSVSGSTLGVDLVPQPADGSGWHLRANVGGLTVAIGSWGVLERQATIVTPTTWWRAAIMLRLTEAHGGFAAGTRFLIGWVSADREPAPAPKPPPPKPKAAPKAPPTTTTTAPPTTATAPTPTVAKPAPQPKPKSKPHTKKKHRKRGFHPGHEPLKATPPLGAETYDFPVYGDVAWGDSYGGLRNDVPGNWHHGDDLFAPLGRPVLAVADGTIFAVGWNKVGGWRLWLRDRWGNCFYYAHLSGYTKLASNNARVRRGQVLGFVGNTGDAYTIGTHLHFEVHPNELLYLGYDGAVDPTSYLADWHRPDKIVRLRPVKLPSHHRGQGSLTDYRRLLALQPLRHRKPAPVLKPSSKPEPRVALASRAGRAAPARGDGWGAAVAAAGLVIAAALAVAAAARRGAQAR